MCRNLLARCPEGLLSVVSDSYDMYHHTEHILGGEFKDQVGVPPLNIKKKNFREHSDR
jgi:hypothetical protein